MSSLIRTMVLLQTEEQISQLRTLKLAMATLEAKTPEEIAKIIDASIRERQRARDQLLEILDWADKQNQGGNQ